MKKIEWDYEYLPENVMDTIAGLICDGVEINKGLREGQYSRAFKKIGKNVLMCGKTIWVEIKTPIGKKTYKITMEEEKSK